jgi:hypothetical protein
MYLATGLIFGLAGGLTVAGIGFPPLAIVWFVLALRTPKETASDRTASRTRSSCGRRAGPDWARSPRETGKDGIEPFDRLVRQVMVKEPYASARRVFWIVDNGSAHRGRASIDCLERRWSNLRLVHLPVHASWLRLELHP